MIEFGIAHEPTKRDGEWHLIGRCVTDIRVGDRFTKFIPHRLVGKPSSENMNFVCEDEVPLDLAIVRILAYGRDFGVLSAGMTAEVVVVGEADCSMSFGSLCGP